MVDAPSECPQCRHTEFIGPHRLASYTAVLLNERTASMLAFVCANCGHVLLYADHQGLENARKYG